MGITILIDIVAIAAIVLIGAFAVVLVSDLLLFMFDKKSQGLIFKRKLKDNEPTYKKEYKEEIVAPMATVAPFVQNEDVDDEDKVEIISGINFDKAVEEQKMLQSGLVSGENFSVKEENTSSHKGIRFGEDSDEDDDFSDEEDEIADIIAEVQAQAIKELEEEDNADSKTIIETIEEEIVEEQPVKKTPRKVVTPKIIFKNPTTEVKEEIEEVKKEVVETKKEIEIEKVEMSKETEEFIFSEIRKLREEVLNLRFEMFADMINAKSNFIAPTKVSEAKSLESTIIDKLDSINELIEKTKQETIIEKVVMAEPEKIVVAEPEKIYIEDETKINELKRESEELKNISDSLTKEKDILITESENLKIEKEKLAKELDELRNSVGGETKPIYSKEYYINRLEDLELQLLDAKKELRSVGKEYFPLRRIKRSFDRDSIKLRRKEALVAKQKVNIYGINNLENIDQEKVKKLEEEVEVLRNLKDSVFHCEQVLKQNKDRYPVLEKTFNILTKHINTIESDIEQIKKSLEWFSANAVDENAA